MHIAEEETKFGLSENELIKFIESEEIAGFKNIEITGLMGMATNTSDPEQIRKEFRFLKGLFDRINSDYDLPNMKMKELSTGMSSDYPIAIEEGSTMIRVGSKIFGLRIDHI